MKRNALLILAISALSCTTRNYNTGMDSNVRATSNIMDEMFGNTGPKLNFDEYEVLFTNPECREYLYNTADNVVSNDGTPLTAKPKGAYCTQADSPASAARPESPQNKLLSWINDASTHEIFFTYLSFSNSAVTNALCKAVTERNVKITFVIDSTSDKTKATELEACKPANGDPSFAPKFLVRGHSTGIGYAHNKIFIMNPKEDKVRLVFSSGNMTSGIVLHHENWHFFKLPSKTYFAQSHLCVMNAEINAFNSAAEYITSVRNCRANTGLQEESDIKAFFIPGDGDSSGAETVKQTNRAGRFLEFAISKASSISVAAHRFSYGKMLRAFSNALNSQTANSLRIITDDDIYWVGTTGVATGDNTREEFNNVKELTELGGQAHYMETNHDMHLLHHNKYLIFDMPTPLESAVYAGAGNLTGTAFRENWENFYFIRIPKIVSSFKTQYERMWKLSTPPEKMPAKDIRPITN